MTSFQLVITSVVIVCAIITDLRKGMIYNWLTLPALVIGLGLAGIERGWTGLGLSVLGMLIGGGVSYIPFAFRLLGGGDVKLLAALGAITGPIFIGETLFVSVLAGGAIGFGVMLVRGKFRPTILWYWGCLTALFRFLFYKGMTLSFPESPDVGETPFAVSICVGVVCAYYYDILGLIFM